MSIDLRQGGGAQAHPNIAEAPSIFSAADLSHMADTAARGLPPPEAHPLRRRRPNRAAPRVDPPEKGVDIPENAPGLVTMASPCTFQTGAADFHAACRVDVGFMDWARRILMNEDGRAMRDKRFRYWVFNANGRRMDVGKRQVFLDRRPVAADIKLPDVAKADKQPIVRKMIARTTEIPGALGEATQSRQRLETTVGQIEREPSRRGDNEGGGGGNTCPLHESHGSRLQMGAVEQAYPNMERTLWYSRGESPEAQKIRFPEEAKGSPGIAERYATLKLQLALMLARKLLECGPGDLKTSIDGSFIKFERVGAGGVTHLQSILWSTMSPRLDVVAENEKARAACGRGNIRLEPEVVNQMAPYYDHHISEIHPANPKEGRDRRVIAKNPGGANARIESSEDGATGGLEELLAVNLPDDASQCAPIAPCVPCADDGNEDRAPSKNRKKPPRARPATPAPSTGRDSQYSLGFGRWAGCRFR